MFFFLLCVHTVVAKALPIQVPSEIRGNGMEENAMKVKLKEC